MDNNPFIESAFISIFSDGSEPIQFNKDYYYTIYYVPWNNTKLFSHVIFTAMDKSAQRYSVGFIYNKKTGKIMLASPDITLNETTENESHILDSGMFTPEQAERFNTLISEFSEGEFKTRQGVNIFYGTDSKKRDFSFFGNNCTTTLYRIFPNLIHKLGACRTLVNSYSLTRMGGKQKTRRVSKLKFKTFRKLHKGSICKN